MPCRILLVLLAVLPYMARGQASQYALRFFGTGTGQQDRVKIRIDAPPAAADVGGDFTIDFWMRAAAAQNTGTVSAGASGDGWITGNVVVDRDIYGAADYGDFGLALGRSGTNRVLGFGASGAGGGLTVVGTNNVADQAWHHVAITRVATSGWMRIYVDGRMDAEGAGPAGNLSYRDGRGTAWPDSDPFLVLAAEKHDAGAAYPSFSGLLDEFRVWTQALPQAQLTGVMQRVVATNTPGLVACYRFEEGSGTNAHDATGLSPRGEVIAGAAGNGQWAARAADTNNTAPVQASGNEGPTAAAAAVPDLGPAPLAVAFSSAGSADPDGGPQPLAFSWVFGDGGASTSANPAHTFTSNGSFLVHLSASDGAATGSASVLVRVGPTSRVAFATVPPGLPLAVDGATSATPFAVTTLAGALLEVAAPSNAVFGGTSLLFRCWSDGGARARSFPAPAGGIALRAGYAAAPQGAAQIPVPGAARNAESYGGSTAFANVYDANALCCGRDAGGEYHVGLAFPLAVPPGATILQAVLRVRATHDQAGSPQFVVRVYDTGTVAAFTVGAGPSVTGRHPLAAAAVAWSPPAFTGGQAYDSPDLAALVQHVVARGDWTSGAHLGFTLYDAPGAGARWRCWSNAQSGTPPVLDLTYATGAAGNDVDGDGMPDGWEAAQGLDCTSGDDAAGDPDGDGVRSGDEYIAGTAPANGADFQRLELLPPQASNAWKISFASVTGRLYRIEASETLAPSDWQPVDAERTGTGAAIEFADPSPSTSRYYRHAVRLAPP